MSLDWAEGREKEYGKDRGQSYGQDYGWEVTHRETVASAESWQSTLGWKPIRSRGAPREPAPSFFRSPRGWFRHEMWSWRFYVWIYAAGALLVALVNLFVLIGVAVNHPFDDNGRSTLYEGSCEWVKSTNRYAHWFFSVFGTGYLSASAYVMYCLTGPTRDEIDRAHAKKKWLDIGVLSIRNTLSVSKKRVAYFVLLGLSSPFIQFFYNSVLFITYSANSYSALVAHETFLQPNRQISISLSQNATEAAILDPHYRLLAQDLYDAAQKGKLERLEPAACIDEYAVALQSRRRNVVLITDDKKRTADVFDAFHAFVPTENPDSWSEQYSWICDDQAQGSDQCLYHVTTIKGQPQKWTVSEDAHVRYCLSERTPERCKLQVSQTMAAVCLFIIFFKVFVMFAVAIHVHESPIMTTGDAIASFMKNPDPHTQGMCMATKRMIEKSKGKWPQTPTFTTLQKFRWNHTIKTRISTVCLIFTASLALNAALFCTVKQPMSVGNLLQIGLAQINRNFFIGWHHKNPRYFVRAVYLASIGHASFGILYILYNNVFYAMTFAREWARYANQRKGLRVSEAPRGEQRTVYFFLMPYKMALPIMIFSCGMHTLISYTLYVVDVETYGHDPSLGQGVHAHVRTPKFDFTTTCFSPLGNAILMVAGAVMIAYLLICSATELQSPMPVTSTCSAAISAACHPDEKELDDFYLRKLQWGVTSVKDGIGHCTFSSLEVEEPNEHTPYA